MASAPILQGHSPPLKTCSHRVLTRGELARLSDTAYYRRIKSMTDPNKYGVPGSVLADSIGKPTQGKKGM